MANLADIPHCDCNTRPCSIPDSGRMWFQTRFGDDGSMPVWVHDVEPRILIAENLVGQSSLLILDGDLLRLTAANGRWVYRIVKQHYGDAVEAVLT